MSKWHLIENQPLLEEIYQFVQKREIFERCTRKSKTLKVIFFLTRLTGVVNGLSPLYFLHTLHEVFVNNYLFKCFNFFTFFGYPRLLPTPTPTTHDFHPRPTTVSHTLFRPSFLPRNIMKNTLNT